MCPWYNDARRRFEFFLTVFVGCEILLAVNTVSKTLRSNKCNFMLVLMQTKEIVDFLQEYRSTGYLISGCLNRNSLHNGCETKLSEMSVKR